jgi:hypothetical protein
MFATILSPAVDPIRQEADEPFLPRYPFFQVLDRKRRRTVVQIDIARGFEARKCGGRDSASQED